MVEVERNAMLFSCGKEGYLINISSPPPNTRPCRHTFGHHQHPVDGDSVSRPARCYPGNGTYDEALCGSDRPLRTGSLSCLARKWEASGKSAARRPVRTAPRGFGVRRTALDAPESLSRSRIWVERTGASGWVDICEMEGSLHKVSKPPDPMTVDMKATCIRQSVPGQPRLVGKVSVKVLYVLYKNK